MQPHTEDLFIKSSVAEWLTLRLHALTAQARAPRAALILHGATLPGFLFDLPVPGASFQRRLAAAGVASYALDARGFGSSSRPQPGTAGCARDRPFGRAAETIDDLADVIGYLRRVRGHDDITLIAFSWGTVAAGCFAARRPAAVDRLVLCGPLHACHNEAWLRLLRDRRNPACLDPALGAYRWTTLEALRARWDGDIPLADKEQWRDRAVLQAVLDGLLASDPLSCDREPPAFRAPNGPLVDLFEVFSGRAPFSAAAIRAPVLCLRGTADTTSTHDDATGLLAALGSSEKDYQVIADGGHFQIAERSMPAIVEACRQFIDSSTFV